MMVLYPSFPQFQVRIVPAFAKTRATLIGYTLRRMGAATGEKIAVVPDFALMSCLVSGLGCGLCSPPFHAFESTSDREDLLGAMSSSAASPSCSCTSARDDRGSPIRNFCGLLGTRATSLERCLFFFIRRMLTFSIGYVR